MYNNWFLRPFFQNYQRMMSLYVASHYKYSPNDLQLLADGPAHQLFVLVGTLGLSLNLLSSKCYSSRIIFLST